MNNVKFILDDVQPADLEIPYIEEANSDNSQYHRAFETSTVVSTQSEISIEIAKLGGLPYAFLPGCAGKRYGYDIRFMLGGSPGIIRVVGLPIKFKATDKKINQVRVQALKIVRDWLRAMVTSQIFSPGHNPLVPYLLWDGGRDPENEVTIGQYIMEEKGLPMLNTGGE